MFTERRAERGVAHRSIAGGLRRHAYARPPGAGAFGAGALGLAAIACVLSAGASAAGHSRANDAVVGSASANAADTRSFDRMPRRTSGKAIAPAIGADDRAAIEATIRSQLDAFGRDDAEQAFGAATADIRRRFGSSDRFMRMVEEEYEPVYRATGLQFLALKQVNGRWVQTIAVVDGDGRVWRASFVMHRQPDRSWKVGGCRLVQTRALAT